MRKERRKNQKVKIWNPGILVVLGVFFSLFLVAAKYVSTNHWKAEIHASKFHFSSDYLESDSIPVFNVSDWNTQGVVLQLFNYEKENIAQVSKEDIAYQISVPQEWDVSVKDNYGNSVNLINGAYLLSTDSEPVSHTVTIRYEGTGKPDSIQIAVTSISPYKKTLKGQFKFSSESTPDFTIEETGEAVKMIVRSNGYTGKVNVKWDSEQVSPDNGNPDVNMSSWKKEEGATGGVFSCEPYHTYTLFFLKNMEGERIEKSSFQVEGVK